MRHVQLVAITWQLDSALTEGYITFSKGFMWSVANADKVYSLLLPFAMHIHNFLALSDCLSNHGIVAYSRDLSVL